jgi:hypothetical protein
LFFDKALIDHIIADTNKYAAYELSGQPAKAQFVLTERMLFTYFAIFLSMWLRPAPAFEDDWSNEDNVLASPFISSLCSRKRWLDIHYWLHLDVLQVQEKVKIQFHFKSLKLLRILCS